jgi:hypothetical protein
MPALPSLSSSASQDFPDELMELPEEELLKPPGEGLLGLPEEEPPEELELACLKSESELESEEEDDEEEEGREEREEGEEGSGGML